MAIGDVVKDPSTRNIESSHERKNRKPASFEIGAASLSYGQSLSGCDLEIIRVLSTHSSHLLASRHCAVGVPSRSLRQEKQMSNH